MKLYEKRLRTRLQADEKILVVTGTTKVEAVIHTTILFLGLVWTLANYNLGWGIFAQNWRFWLGIIIVFSTSYTAAIHWLVWLTYGAMVTDIHVHRVAGFWKIYHSKVKLSSIAKITVTRRLRQRLTGVGTIRLNAGGAEEAEVLPGVKNSDEFASRLKEMGVARWNF